MLIWIKKTYIDFFSFIIFDNGVQRGINKKASRRNDARKWWSEYLIREFYHSKKYSTMRR